MDRFPAQPKWEISVKRDTMNTQSSVLLIATYILVTSSKKGFAKAVKSNSDASCSLGVAVGKSVKGRVLIRIVRVNDIPK